MLFDRTSEAQIHDICTKYITIQIKQLFFNLLVVPYFRYRDYAKNGIFPFKSCFHLQNSFKAVTPSPPPSHSSSSSVVGTMPTTSSVTSSSATSFNAATSPDHLTYLYRHHKALLESVKKEQAIVSVILILNF